MESEVDWELLWPLLFEHALELGYFKTASFAIYKQKQQ